MTKQLIQQLGDLSLQTWVFISTKQFFRSPATSLRSGYSILYTTDFSTSFDGKANFPYAL